MNTFFYNLMNRSLYKLLLLILLIPAANGSSFSEETLEDENTIYYSFDSKGNIEFKGEPECFLMVLKREVAEGLVDQDGTIILTYGVGEAVQVRQSFLEVNCWDFMTKENPSRIVARIGRYQYEENQYVGLLEFGIGLFMNNNFRVNANGTLFNGALVVDKNNGIHINLANGRLFLNHLLEDRKYTTSRKRVKTGSTFNVPKQRGEINHPDRNLHYLICCVGNLIDANKLKLKQKDVLEIQSDSQAEELFRTIKRKLITTSYKKDITKAHFWRVEGSDIEYISNKIKRAFFNSLTITGPTKDRVLTTYFAGGPLSQVKKAQLKNPNPSKLRKIESTDFEERKIAVTITEGAGSIFHQNNNSRYSAIKGGLATIAKRSFNEPSAVTNALANGFRRVSRVSTFNYAVLKEVLEKLSCHRPEFWRIYDPFGGWGDRMIAAGMLAEKYDIASYLCIDVNTDLAPVYANIQEFLKDMGSSIRIEWLIGQSELIDPSTVWKQRIPGRRPNLVFTSPPYPGYNGVALEMYSEDDGQSFRAYKTLDTWRKDFMKRWVYNCLDALAVTGFMVINIADGSFGSICRYLLDEVERYQEERTGCKAAFLGAIGYTQANSSRKKGVSKIAMEPVFIWQKQMQDTSTIKAVMS